RKSAARNARRSLRNQLRCSIQRNISEFQASLGPDFPDPGANHCVCSDASKLVERASLRHLFLVQGAEGFSGLASNNHAGRDAENFSAAALGQVDSLGARPAPNRPSAVVRTGFPKSWRAFFFIHIWLFDALLFEA